MLFDIDKKPSVSLAALDDTAGTLTYGEAVALCENMRQLLPERALVFCLCENRVGALAGFLALYENRDVCLLLGAGIDGQLLENLVQTYSPAYFWLPTSKIDCFGYDKVFEFKDFALCKTGLASPEMHPNLSMLMTTSGTTGSPKLVRHKYGNIESNARNVAQVFGWTPQDRGIIDLPLQYTMGLNVITTHLQAGATLLLVQAHLMSPKFWAFIKEHEATNFTGVPFSYEILSKLRFCRMNLPHLHTIAEGGGKLPDTLFEQFSTWAQANGKRFFATFGTTETAARLAYLNPELAVEKCGSIGNAIPEGRLSLVDENGNEISTPDTEGELRYEGPNVTMGYAECCADLCLGDEFCGAYYTGDIARRDVDGCYYIVGRKKRFLKLFGLRVSLDQMERIIYENLAVEVACSGNDSRMLIYITAVDKTEVVKQLVAEKTGLATSSYSVIAVPEIPRSSSGKVNYKVLDAIQ